MRMSPLFIYKSARIPENIVDQVPASLGSTDFLASPAHLTSGPGWGQAVGSGCHLGVLSSREVQASLLPELHDLTVCQNHRYEDPTGTGKPSNCFTRWALGLLP